MTSVVSVVIPAYNAATFLPGAIASVRAQTAAVGEIVVVDDGSTDGTAAVAGRLGARVITQARAGAGAARNRGAGEAAGTWLAFLDADDLWTPEKTARQLAWMAAQPETDVVFGHGANFAEEPGGMRREEASRPAYLPGAALLRRGFFLERARFDPAVTPSEVVEWNLRLRAAGTRIGVVPELVLWRRLHPGNTRRMGEGGRDLDLQLVRNHLRHRRRNGPDAAG